MKTKELCIFSLLLFISIMLFGVAQSRVSGSRAEFNYRQRLTEVAIPSILLEAMAGEFKGTLANYFLLEAGSFIGGLTEADEQDWGAVARLLEQSSRLDPYFKQTYTLAQGTLPWYMQEIETTMRILERSRDHRDWDWMPGFYIGFNHFYFHQNHVAASNALMQASNVSNAPPHLATWAARLASQAGQHQVAIDFLTGIIENTEDVHQRAMLSERLEAVRGSAFLQKAVDHYAVQFGRLPHSLDELVEDGLISEIPENPYDRSYMLKDGLVDF